MSPVGTHAISCSMRVITYKHKIYLAVELIIKNRTAATANIQIPELSQRSDA
jgi:hypothetical protein